MTSKDLKKLSRKELIELFLAQTRELESMKESLTSELEQTRSHLTHELELTKKELEVAEQMVAQMKAERKLYQANPAWMKETGDESVDEMAYWEQRDAAGQTEAGTGGSGPATDAGPGGQESDGTGNNDNQNTQESEGSKWEEELPQAHMTSTGIRNSHQ